MFPCIVIDLSDGGVLQDQLWSVDVIVLCEMTVHSCKKEGTKNLDGEVVVGDRIASVGVCEVCF